MDNQRIIITGHVDHGKSTLIGRLIYDTGSFPQDRIAEIMGGSFRNKEFAYFLDCFKEERERNMTVDTTQVLIKNGRRSYTIIDAPGHKEFMRNMITGASYANAAVLIIDVSEGLMEQTRRHAYVLSFLGIRKIIVVINKMDKIEYAQGKYIKLKELVDNFLKNLNINASYYIPVSAFWGENIIKRSKKMSWYRGPSLLKSFSSLVLPTQGSDKNSIFIVQDVYRPDGVSIAVGRVESGAIRAKDKMRVFPSADLVEIKSIEKFLHKERSANAGECVGVILKEQVDLKRGSILYNSSAKLNASETFEAYMLIFSDNLKKEDNLSIRCGTQEAEATIEEIKERMDSSSLEITGKNVNDLKYLDAAKVKIRVKSPFIVKKIGETQALGRFVLFNNSSMCAAGIVTGIN